MRRPLLVTDPGLVSLQFISDAVLTNEKAKIHTELFSGIQLDPTLANGLNLWVVADNLRKGAATNAVQIAELIVRRRAAQHK